MENMNVLSLFDGIASGRVALERAGHTVSNYYASEIDKHAIKVTQKNYPDTIQLGDVRNVHVKDLPHVPDLIQFGSPCQGFSFAGKQLNFDDPRSALFFEAVRILEEARELNPNVYFFMENVMMQQEFQDVISQFLGISPYRVNSSLFSAQNRDRIYWTNIPFDRKIIDKGIVLKDILLDPTDVPVIKNHGKLIHKPIKSQCLDANYHKGPDNHGQLTGCVKVGEADGVLGFDVNRRVYSANHKSPALLAHETGGAVGVKVAIDSDKWRKLHPIECERLQTLPDNYTEGISDTQRYRALGNGWTVDVIAHFYKGIGTGFRKPDVKKQNSLFELLDFS